jgi:hypothetical protein
MIRSFLVSLTLLVALAAGESLWRKRRRSPRRPKTITTKARRGCSFTYDRWHILSATVWRSRRRFIAATSAIPRSRKVSYAQY